jgi:hypothetical protein
MMLFKPEGLPRLDAERSPLSIRDDRTSPMILVRANGAVVFENTKGGKDHLVDVYQTGDLLLFAWSGQWRTDVFVVDKDFIDNVYLPRKNAEIVGNESAKSARAIKRKMEKAKKNEFFQLSIVSSEAGTSRIRDAVRAVKDV